jgi:hypothetical protein
MPQMRARSTSLSTADGARFSERPVCRLNGVNLTTALWSAAGLLRPRVIPLESSLWSSQHLALLSADRPYPSKVP